MNRDEPGRVVILGPTVNLDKVQVRAVIHVVVLPVAEGDLEKNVQMLNLNKFLKCSDTSTVSSAID